MKSHFFDYRKQEGYETKRYAPFGSDSSNRRRNKGDHQGARNASRHTQGDLTFASDDSSEVFAGGGVSSPTATWGQSGGQKGRRGKIKAKRSFRRS